MSHKTTLWIILVIAICGVLFSGYLSYLELFSETGCSASPISCGTKNIEIADLPACVYGFIMYLIVLILSAASLYRSKK